MSKKYNERMVKLEQERASLQEQVDKILLAEGVYTREDGDKVDQMLSKLDAIGKQLAALAKMAAADDEDAYEDSDDNDEAEGEEDIENSARWTRHPAVIRSRGRKSSPSNIHEHATRERFSLGRACQQIIRKGHLYEGIELEVDQELSRSKPDREGNVLIPLNWEKLNTRASDLTLTTGAGAVPVYWDAAEFVSYLYALMVGPKLGVKYVNGLAGVTKYPRQTSPLTVQGVGEDGAASGSDPALDDVVLTPTTITANCTVSRKFILQSILPAEQYVQNAMAQSIAVQVDQYLLTGTGSNQPTGVLNNPSITNVEVASSNAISWQNLINLQKNVAAANAFFGNLGFVTSPAGYSKLQTTAKIGTTYPDFLINNSGEISGLPVVRSSQVPTNLSYCGTNSLTAIIFGAWQFCVAATFGDGLDIIVDPFTQSKNGGVVITGLLDFDTEVEHGGAFSYCANFS